MILRNSNDKSFIQNQKSQEFCINNNSGLNLNLDILEFMEIKRLEDSNFWSS